MATNPSPATAGDASKKTNPAYLPFDTFKNFVDTLHKTALPSIIDKSLMGNLAGGTQSHLMLALKFLKLIDSRGAVTPKMERLHKAAENPNDFAAELSPVITEAYAPIIGPLDVSTATSKQLDDAFRTHTSLDGVMLDRGTRFFLAAMKAAKLPVSPHLLQRKPRNPKKQNGKGAAKSDDAPKGGATDRGGKSTQQTPPAPPDSNISFPIYLGSARIGNISVPKDLRKEDLPMLNSIVAAVQAYATIEK